MEVSNSFFTNRTFVAPPTFFSYQFPLQHTSGYPNTAWSGSDFAGTPFDDALQMQQLRFPTPPITPPKNVAALHVDATQSRTKSVIMKVGEVNRTDAGQDLTELSSPYELKSISHDAAGSESSSPSSDDYICNWIDCGKYFDSLDSLASHVTQLHAVASIADGLYYCRWKGCQRTDRGFNARYKMLVHVRTHTKEKPHHCHLCEKSFSRAENLKIHIRSHSGEKPYVCIYEGCGKAYSNSSDRFKHTRTHSMEKPYMCKVPGCQKRYTDPSSLRKHVKTFKHTVQLIDAASIHSGNNRNDREPLIQDHRTSNPNSPTQSPTPAYLCVPPAQGAHCYIGISNEDICHIKGAQLDCFYSSDSATADNYWITDRPEYRAHYALHREDALMDIDLETPLDLRINRR